MTYCKITNCDDMLTINPQMQEGWIRDYIIHLRRERNLSPATVSTYLAAITHFYGLCKVKKTNYYYND
jgi:site-specific recombinase XerD